MAARILIVDDEPFNVDYLEQELEESDYAISTAANGHEALAAVRAQAPDLILLDIMMPMMDGYEVLARLKADPATREIPVIIISAANDLPSVVRGIQLGAEDYLPKPFEPVLLHARIVAGLEKKRLHDLQQLYLKNLERELEIGREIQRSFLPDELPAVPGWELAGYLKAAKEVAGDFYDAFLLPGGKLACVVGDVCGKGVGAALFMTLFRSLIRAAALSDLSCEGVHLRTLDNAERLRHVVAFTNRYVARTHEAAGMFTTLFIGFLDPDDGRLAYANCGGDPPFVVRDGAIIGTLALTGPVVGILDDATFDVQTLNLQPGDLLAAYTDGVTDALNAEGAPFGVERLRAVLGENDSSADELLARVGDRLRQFSGQAVQFDDITLLAVKRGV